MSAGSSASPWKKPLSRREEENMGGICAAPGCGWGATCEGCSAVMYWFPLRAARAAGCSCTSCPVQEPEPLNQQERRWARSGERGPRHAVLRSHQLPSGWLSTARISRQAEEESGEKNAGIIAGVGKRDALRALGQPDSPAAGTSPRHPGHAGRGAG